MKAVILLTVALCSAAYCAEAQPEHAALTLPDLLGARAIQISHSWTGLSPVAPTRALWRLERGADGFNGSANFRARMPPLRKETSESLMLPAAVAAQFLAALASVPVREAEIDPRSPPGNPIVKLPASAAPRITDHYPSTTITVSLADTTVSYSSTSQEPSGRPWVVSVGNRMYISDSEATGHALDALRGYLKWERYSELQTQVMNAWQRSR